MKGADTQYINLCCVLVYIAADQLEYTCKFKFMGESVFKGHADVQSGLYSNGRSPVLMKNTRT